MNVAVEDAAARRIKIPQARALRTLEALRGERLKFKIALIGT